MIWGVRIADSTVILVRLFSTANGTGYFVKHDHDLTPFTINVGHGGLIVKTFLCAPVCNDCAN